MFERNTLLRTKSTELCTLRTFFGPTLGTGCSFINRSDRNAIRVRSNFLFVIRNSNLNVKANRHLTQKRRVGWYVSKRSYGKVKWMLF